MPRTPDTSDEGLERLRAVVRANPRSTAFVPLAHALCDVGRPSEAEDVCREGLAQHPRLVTGQVALGRSLLVGGRTREAQEVLIEATKAGPEHVEAFRWLAEILSARGDAPRARVLLEYADDLSPGDDRIGELLRQAGGHPAPKPVRPLTDFEDTRVGNARALAERMHEPPNVWSRATDEELRPAGDEHDDPTVVAGAGPLPWPPFAGAEEPPPRKTLDVRAPSPAPAPPLQVAAPATIPDAPPVPGKAAAAPPSGPLSRRVLLAGVGVAAAGGLLWAGLSTRTVATPAVPAPSPPVIGTPRVVDNRPSQVERALDQGTLAAFAHAASLGAELAREQKLDPELSARLVFADALAGHDFGNLASLARAKEQLEPAHTDTTPHVRALKDAARALLMIEEGRLTEARALSDGAARVWAAAAEVKLVAARTRILAGDLDGAGALLEPSAEATYVPLLLERAALAGLKGDSATALAVLAPLVEKDPGNHVVLLPLAEMQRLAGVKPRAIERTCKEIVDAPRLHAACLIARAAELRASGQRSAAVKALSSITSEAANALPLSARAALAMANLGQIDEAAALVKRAEEGAGTGFPPVRWASLAVALGRAQTPAESTPPLVPFSAESRITWARHAFARGGAAALQAALSSLPQQVIDSDRDLGELAALGHGSKLSVADRKALARAVDKGEPVAAYVLGRLAQQDGNVALAGRYLGRALTGHADACQAFGLLRGLPKVGKRSRDLGPATKALQSDNRSCVHLLGGRP